MPYANTNNIDTNHCQALASLFHQCFEQSYQTRLQGGAQEPLYTPVTETSPAMIYFTRDYFSSALHEIAHWCIAGPQRRQQEDYGYWYQPDGRTPDQQRLFESVEVQPQAMEWLFSACCDIPFRISADNLNGNAGVSQAFKDNIHRQALIYLEQGLPDRAQQFANAAQHWFRPDRPLQKNEFRREQL